MRYLLTNRDQTIFRLRESGHYTVSRKNAYEFTQDEAFEQSVNGDVLDLVPEPRDLVDLGDGIAAVVVIGSRGSYNPDRPDCRVMILSDRLDMKHTDDVLIKGILENEYMAQIWNTWPIYVSQIRKFVGTISMADYTDIRRIHNSAFTNSYMHGESSIELTDAQIEFRKAEYARCQHLADEVYQDLLTPSTEETTFQ